MEFYNDVAENYYNDTYNKLQEYFIKDIDNVALLNLANLHAQNQEVLRLIKYQNENDRWQVENQNNKGKSTYQPSILFKVQMSLLAEITKLQDKLGLNIKSRQLIKKKEKEIITEEDELFGDV